MEKIIVERTEEGLLILEKEDGSRGELALSEIDFSVSEGDVLIFDGEKYFKDDSEKAERISSMLELQKKLLKKAKNK